MHHVSCAPITFIPSRFLECRTETLQCVGTLIYQFIDKIYRLYECHDEFIIASFFDIKMNSIVWSWIPCSIYWSLIDTRPLSWSLIHQQYWQLMNCYVYSEVQKVLWTGTVMKHHFICILGNILHVVNNCGPVKSLGIFNLHQHWFWRQDTGGTKDGFLTIRPQLGNSVKFEANTFKHVCKMSTIVFIPQCPKSYLFNRKHILHVLNHCGPVKPLGIVSLYRYCFRPWRVAGLAPGRYLKQ